MATVTGMTAAAIEERFDAMVVAVRVEENGQLIYTTRGGEEINAGNLVESDSAVNQAYPINSLFFATVPTNPATLLGVGTWVRFAKGRTLVSLDEADTDFDAAEETGGAKTVTLTSAQIPSHQHNIPQHQHSIPSHTHPLSASYSVQHDNVDENGTDGRMSSWTFANTGDTPKTGNTGAGGAGSTDLGGAGITDASGGGQSHPNLPPYVVVYIWKRTA